MYAKVTNNIIEPNFTLTAIKRQFPTMSFPANVPDELLKNLGYYPIVVSYNGITNRFTNYGDAEYSFDGEKVTATYNTQSIDLENAKNIAKELVKQERKRIEESGITLPTGQRVYTFREDQSMIQGLVLSLQLGLVQTINFKTMDGFIPLDAQGIMALAIQVAAHVQGAFSQEAERIQEIDACVDVSQIEALLQQYNI